MSMVKFLSFLECNEILCKGCSILGDHCKVVGASVSFTDMLLEPPSNLGFGAFPRMNYLLEPRHGMLHTHRYCEITIRIYTCLRQYCTLVSIPFTSQHLYQTRPDLCTPAFSHRINNSSIPYPYKIRGFWHLLLKLTSPPNAFPSFPSPFQIFRETPGSYWSPSVAWPLQCGSRYPTSNPGKHPSDLPTWHSPVTTGRYTKSRLPKMEQLGKKNAATRGIHDWAWENV